MVGLRARFVAPLTGLNSPAVIIMLLTIPRQCPSVFLRYMSMLFHSVLVTLLLVSLVVFSSTVSIFLNASGFNFFDYHPLPPVSCSLPRPIIIFFEFLISYKLFII
jgi:hypothetical protein